MRIAASSSCLSWIPPLSVEGTFKLAFTIGVAHYDAPPPDADPDVDALLAADAIRFANRLSGWIDVDGDRIVDAGMNGNGAVGRTRLRVGPLGITFAAVALPTLQAAPDIQPDHVRFVRTAGGHTGVAVPHRIHRPPFWRITAPIAWSTLAVTVRADGSSGPAMLATSPFPRHYLYDSDGRLTRKTGLMRHQPWLSGAEDDQTPWTGGAGPAVVTGVPSPPERAVTNAILVSKPHHQHRLPAGLLLRERPIPDTSVHVLLDGILVIELDSEPISEVGPGAIFDPAMRTAESKARVEVRAATDCRLAIVHRRTLEDDGLPRRGRRAAGPVARPSRTAAMTELAPTNDGTLLSALMTEHFVLQSARGAITGEATSRVSIYLATLSSALIALGFVSSRPEALTGLAIGVFPVVVLLGEFTFLRLVQIAREDIAHLQAIQLIRRRRRLARPEGGPARRRRVRRSGTRRARSLPLPRPVPAGALDRRRLGSPANGAQPVSGPRLTPTTARTRPACHT